MPSLPTGKLEKQILPPVRRHRFHHHVKTGMDKRVAFTRAFHPQSGLGCWTRLELVGKCKHRPKGAGQEWEGSESCLAQLRYSRSSGQGVYFWVGHSSTSRLLLLHPPSNREWRNDDYVENELAIAMECTAYLSEFRKKATSKFTYEREPI